MKCLHRRSIAPSTFQLSAQRHPYLGLCSLRSATIVQVGKGFGTQSASKTRADEDSASENRRGRMKRVRRNLEGTIPNQQQQDIMSGQAFQGALDVANKAVEAEEAAEFAQRLQALKTEGQEKKKQMASSPGSPGPSNNGSPGPIAAFDAAPESVYANPPSIGETLMNQLNSEVSDPKLKNAQIGPSQLAIAGGAIIFGLVFVLVSGGDFAPDNRYKGVRSAIEPPDSVEAGIIKTRISALEQQLKDTPGNPEATQALALSYAQLLQYDKAANLLDKLAISQPNNPDAWRLLGETSLLGEQASRAVKAYERAISLRNDDLQIATGMVDAYIANGQQSKAVDYLKELKTRVPTVSALGITAVDARTESTEPAGNDEAAATSNDAASQEATSSQPAPDTASEAAAAGSSKFRTKPIRPLDPVAVDLLLAKTYNAWRGHDSDALATYDALIARFPEDFRGYLAKGVFLRDKGRRADAERMFIQAKFYAPENRQQFIRETVQTKPIVELPEQ